MLVLATLLASTWVLFSPVPRRNTNVKSYEDGDGKQWESPSSFSLEKVALRWGLPPSAYGNDALAGGITFALHRDFCTRLLKLFPESAEHLQSSQVLASTFLSCTDLRDTIKRAFDTWAINHRTIYFRDVSDQCLAVSSYESCPAAELFLVPDTAQQGSITKVGDLAAV